MEHLKEVFLFDSTRLLQFNSLYFFIAFSAFFLIYSFAFHKVRLRNTLLLVFSLFVYYKMTGAYALVLVVLSFLQFLIGKKIFSAREGLPKKLWLWLGVLITAGSLIYFKYTDFFLDIFGKESTWKIIAPIGISYYVFKSISYLVDCYNEMIDEPEKNYFDYLLYMSLFTTILAGPIVKARDILPQLKSAIDYRADFASKGFFLLLSGIVKKYLVADFLWVNFCERVLGSPHLFGGFEHLMNLYSCALQFYFDFSGYTDMMLGISLLMGLQLEGNFNRPFLAQNITDFWKRWHITLSTWLNEYLFMPISFYLRSWARWGAVVAAIITFVISGIWHGPRYTYIFWGLMHGVAIAFEVATQKSRSNIKKKVNPGLYRFFSILITFHFVAASILIFDAIDLATGFDMLQRIFTTFDAALIPKWFMAYQEVFIVLLAGFTLHFTPPQWKTAMIGKFQGLPWYYRSAIAVVVIFVVYQFFSADSQPFVYLKF